jgi:hypothetical protein
VVTRPGIPSQGIAYLRKVVQDNMIDSIEVIRPGEPVYDASTGYATGVTSATPGYEGRAHIHPPNVSAGFDPGQGMVSLATVQVTIPFDAEPIPRAEDQVKVTLALSDPAMTGETLRIAHVSGGGIGFVTRVLTCTYEKDTPFSPEA